MPQSTVIKNGYKSDAKCTKPTETFTGDVYLDPIHFDTEAAIANVTFTPCARTHWHTHEKGQMIKVVAGSGWICDKGSVPQRLKTGDVVWAPAGTTHWHGADDDSIMTHFVVGLGKTVWHEAVTEEEYGLKDKV
jgi:quercetin dioxygenase-like cupin family protein